MCSRRRSRLPRCQRHLRVYLNEFLNYLFKLFPKVLLFLYALMDFHLLLNRYH